MIGAKLDGETQRKKLISTRHPKQAATRSIFAPAKARRRKKLKQAATRSILVLAKARRRKSSSKQQRDPSLRWLKQEDGKAQASVAEGGEYP